MKSVFSSKKKLQPATKIDSNWSIQWTTTLSSPFSLVLVNKTKQSHPAPNSIPFKSLDTAYSHPILENFLIWSFSVQNHTNSVAFLLICKRTRLPQNLIDKFVCGKLFSDRSMLLFLLFFASQYKLCLCLFVFLKYLFDNNVQTNI